MASRDCFFLLHFCTQTEKNVARTVDGPRARRRRYDTHSAKTTCSSTHNAHIVCANHLLRPGSRQRARPCRSKMRGVSACPRNIFQKGYENLVVIFRTGKKPCTWVHVVVSKRRKVEASNSEQKVCCAKKKCIFFSGHIAELWPGLTRFGAGGPVCPWVFDDFVRICSELFGIPKIHERPTGRLALPL